ALHADLTARRGRLAQHLPGQHVTLAPFALRVEGHGFVLAQDTRYVARGALACHLVEAKRRPAGARWIEHPARPLALEVPVAEEQRIARVVQPVPGDVLVVGSPERVREVGAPLPQVEEIARAPLRVE